MTSDDIKGGTKDASERAAATARAAASGIGDAAQATANRAKEKLGQANEATHDLYERARGSVADAAERMPGSASDAVDMGQRVYRRTSKHVASRVGKQPVEALLLAGAIGYLVGWAANRG